MGMPPEEIPAQRDKLLVRALLLSYVSIGTSIVLGSIAIGTGLRSGSLGLVGVGLNLIGDLVGSIGLVWRFKRERRSSDSGSVAERRISILVSLVLGVVALTLLISSVSELIAGTVPHRSVVALVTSAITAVVLLPLGYAKRNVGQSLHSEALRGDGAVSLIGAVMGLAALVGLILTRTLGWWWSDRCVALLVALVAAGEGLRIARSLRAHKK
jgi:divalent metal cation (Fe/Co/Zn/Cd) transporter